MTAMSRVLARLRLAGGHGSCCRNISTGGNSVLTTRTSYLERTMILQGFLQKSSTKNLLQNHESRRAMSIIPKFLRRKKSSDDEEDEERIPEVKTLSILEEEPKQLTPEELEAKRDISRLRPYHLRLVHGKIPHPEPTAWYHHTVRYKQRIFGQFGESSGVNPGLMWMTQEELQDKIKYESICNPLTIQELVEKKRAQRQREKDEIEERIKDVNARMEKVDQFKQDLLRRQTEKENEMKKAKARREKMVEEVRRHFGYTVDSKDERFKELLEKKEKEEKKSQKEARKLEKQQKMLEKIQSMQVPVKGNEIKPIPKNEKRADNDDDD